MEQLASVMSISPLSSASAAPEQEDRNQQGRGRNRRDYVGQIDRSVAVRGRRTLQAAGIDGR